MTDRGSSRPTPEGFLTANFGLTGKTVVVTGGGGTLCGAMAKGFALAGANVVLWGRGKASSPSPRTAATQCLTRWRWTAP